LPASVFERNRRRWVPHGTPEEIRDYFRAVTVPFAPLLDRVSGDTEVDHAVLTAIRKQFDGEWARGAAQMVIATAVRR